MTPFTVQSSEKNVELRLCGDCTIEHAAELRAALAPLAAGRELAIDSSAVDRLDAAMLQVLLSAAAAADRLHLHAPSEAWRQSLLRYAAQSLF